MAQSSKNKEVRIVALLVIDTAFCLLEAITGYAVHSLALVADAFHMLNDIFSLVVALWAVRVARNRNADATYTYGWQRAEILGALVNAVFLLALCMTIFIEAIQRFISPEIITNPKLIFGVGLAGLASNFIGLFLFHEHGHGGHSHSHAGGFAEELEGEMEGEESGSHSHYHDDANGGYRDEVDERHEHSHDHSHKQKQPQRSHPHSEHHDEESAVENVEPVLPEVLIAQQHAALDNGASSSSPSSSNADLLHSSHKHELQKAEKPRGHNKSLNMQGVFLHVLGDALGNVGVIISALLIWKTDYSWRFYFDPAISLFITAIIFSTALPLCRSSSKILLQATPAAISAEDVQGDVLSLPGVISVHDFHIWNLTEKISIASLHAEINVTPDKFHDVVNSIRHCLHAYGIHSVTVQPEFLSDQAAITKSSNNSQSSQQSFNETYGAVSNCSQNFLPLNKK